MTICDGMTPTDPRVSEDPQDIAELIEGTISLAISIFSFPLVVMTHLGDPASAQAQDPPGGANRVDFRRDDGRSV